MLTFTPLILMTKVIFDSGASLAITPHHGNIKPFPTERQLGGMANGMLIEGIRLIKWAFKTESTVLVVTSQCYYVPDSKA